MRLFSSRLINFLIVLSIVLGIIYFIKDRNWHSFYFLTFLCPIFLLWPRYFYRKIWQKRYNHSLLKILEYFIASIFTLNLLGNIGLYSIRIEYDSFVHLTVPMLLAVPIGFILTTFSNPKNIQNINLFKLSLTVFLIIIVLGIVWEFYEYINDKLLGTSMFFDPRQGIVLDTSLDLILDTIGAFIGSLLIFLKWPQWYSKWLIDNKKSDNKKRQELS